jgi:hypothetical protein
MLRRVLYGILLSISVITANHIFYINSSLRDQRGVTAADC